MIVLCCMLHVAYAFFILTLCSVFGRSQKAGIEVAASSSVVRISDTVFTEMQQPIRIQAGETTISLGECQEVVLAAILRDLSNDSLRWIC